MLSSIAVGNNLIISNYYTCCNTKFLQDNTLFDGAKIVTQMKPARWTITCKHSVFFGIDL